MVERVDAKKVRLDATGAVALTRGMTDLYSAKGKRVIHLDLRTSISREELLAAMIGPSGNLRAPVLRRGKVLIVGFSEELFAKVFG